MKSYTERKLIRWLHILIGIPVIGYIYGPVSKIPEAVMAVRYIFFPILILSGLWLWKGYIVKNFIRRIVNQEFQLNNKQKQYEKTDH